MINVRNTILTFLFFQSGFGLSQSFNAGLVFQYHVFKQVDVNASTVTGTYSHDLFKVKDNDWKVFAAGQSILIGMMGQWDYKKFYLTTELNFNLNTYRYGLYYSLAPDQEEKVIFETLYQQIEVPVYLGYQFQTTNLFRYSLFAGIFPAIPVYIQNNFEEPLDPDIYMGDRYAWNDMRYILYNDDPYLNGVAGFCVHFASLAKLDFRYIRRFGSPGNDYDVNFNTLGVAFTYYLQLHLRKKQFYYED